MIVAATGCVAADVTRGVRLVDDLGIDSLEMADLLVEIEIRYGVVLAADTVQALVTVDDLVSAVQRAPGHPHQ